MSSFFGGVFHALTHVSSHDEATQGALSGEPVQVGGWTCPHDVMSGIVPWWHWVSVILIRSCPFFNGTLNLPRAKLLYA